jgi:hypothetical protein
MLVAPERLMSSLVMIWMAEAVVESFSGRRETEVTSTSMSCSRLSRFNAPGDGRVSGSWAWAGLSRRNEPNARQAEAVERARWAVRPRAVTQPNRRSWAGGVSDGWDDWRLPNLIASRDFQGESLIPTNCVSRLQGPICDT